MTASAADTAGARRAACRAHASSAARGTNPAGPTRTPVAEQGGRPTRTATPGRCRGGAGHPGPAVTAVTEKPPARAAGLPGARLPR